jgi:hypothetical protein
MRKWGYFLGFVFLIYICLECYRGNTGMIELVLVVWMKIKHGFYSNKYYEWIAISIKTN